MYKKNIIITGSKGFLGKNLSNILRKKYSITKLSFKKFSKMRDDRKRKYLDTLIKKIKPFAIIHLATYFSKKKDNKTQNECTHVNYTLSKMLYQATVDNSVNRFIYSGSNYENVKDNKKLYPYLRSKKKFSIYLNKSNSKKTKLICLYLPNVFGEKDKRKKILNYLFQIIKIKKKINFKIFYSSAINFIYVGDVVEIISKCLIKKFINRKFFFNIRFKRNYSLSHVIRNFSKLNKHISYEIIKKSSQNLEIDENDIIYKYKKFPFYKPKIDVNHWIQKKLSN